MIPRRSCHRRVRARESSSRAIASRSGSSAKTSAFGGVAEIGLDLALQLDGHRVALAIQRLAGRDADPLLADAVFFDVGLLDALEADADAALQQISIVIGAVGIDGEAVGRRGAQDRKSVG